MGKIKVPKKNKYKRVARGDISRSLSIMKRREREAIQKAIKKGRKE